MVRPSVWASIPSPNSRRPSSSGPSANALPSAGAGADEDAGRLKTELRSASVAQALVMTCWAK